jgi:hypothetical protein
MVIAFGVVFMLIATVLSVLSFPAEWLSGPAVFFWGLAAACIMIGKMPTDGVDSSSETE